MMGKGRTGDFFCGAIGLSRFATGPLDSPLLGRTGTERAHQACSLESDARGSATRGVIDCARAKFLSFRGRPVQRYTLLLLLLTVLPGLQAQAPSDDFFAQGKNDRPFTLTLQNGATHQPLRNVDVDVELAAPDGSNTGAGGATDAVGSVSLSLNPKTVYTLTVNARGFAPLTEPKWTADQAAVPIAMTPGQADPAVLPDQSAVQQQFADPSSQPTSGSDIDAQTGQPQSPSMEATIRSVLAKIVFALLPVAAFFALREIAVRSVLFFMMRRRTPKSDAVPAAGASEPPSTTPAFLELDTLNGILLNGAAQARLERAETTNRRKLNILLLSLVVQVAALGAAVSLMAWLTPHAFAGEMMSIGIGAGVLLVIDGLLAFYAWSTWLQGARILELVAAVSAALTVGLTIFGLTQHLSLFLALPAILQIAYLVQQWRELRSAAKQEGNRKLVILRVFGSDENTAFTFGKLMNGWRFLGSFLTIVDPSYIRHEFSFFHKGNLGKSLGATLTFGTLASVTDQLLRFLPTSFPNIIPAAWQALPPEELQNRVHVFAYVIVAIFAVGPMFFAIWRGFLKSPEQAFARVDRVQHATLGLESDFPGAALFCFDDVWQPAVRRMFSVADAVLMDLRGFSAQRQGCAYEIGELVDYFPVDRLLFLVDSSTPRELFYGLVRQRWDHMRSDSPNRTLAEPIIQVYETADQDTRDIHRIAGILSASLDGHTAATEQLVCWEPDAETKALPVGRTA